MPFADSDGTAIYYEDTGQGDAVLLCLPGWCVHHTIYCPLAERLSTDHRILAMDWRGHGKSQAAERDFGYPEMVADAIAVFNASGARSVIPITQAHGGWVGVELLRRLGERVKKLIFISWNPILTGQNPLAPTLLRGMKGLQGELIWQALQDDAKWGDAVAQVVDTWVEGSPPAVEAQIRDETASHGFEDWARGGREIAAMFAQEIDPLHALSKSSAPASALHIYAQPRIPEWFAAQELFALDHPWFHVRRLEAVSHFPTLEVPDETAAAIRRFI